MKQVLLALITIIAVVSLATMGTYAHFSDTETSPGNVLETGSLDLQLADWNEDFTADPLYDSVTQTWYYAGSYPPGMKPGDNVTGTVFLKNVGSLSGTSLDIYCQIINTELTAYDTDNEHIAENAMVGGRDDDHDGVVDEDPYNGIDDDGDGLIDEDLGVTDIPIPRLPGYGIFDKDTVMIINYMKYQNSPPGPIDIVWNNGTEWNSTKYNIDDADGDGVITLYDFKKYPVRNLLPPVSGLAYFEMKVTFGAVNQALDEYQGDQTQMTLVFTLK